VSVMDALWEETMAEYEFAGIREILQSKTYHKGSGQGAGTTSV
jgi:hypothetical protein